MTTDDYAITAARDRLARALRYGEERSDDRTVMLPVETWMMSALLGRIDQLESELQDAGIDL